MKITGLAAPLAFLALGLLLGGCELFEPPTTQSKRNAAVQHNKKSTTAQAEHKPSSYWNGEVEEATGSPRIEIALSEQRAYFYKGKTLVGVSTVSTGKKGFETPPGTYKVTQKDEKHVSNLYGDYVDAEGEVVKKNVDVTKDPIPPGATFRGAKMPYFMRLTQGYGMHAGYLPGYRASHGCIRMPRTMAEHFFGNAELGTPVTVKE